MCVAVVCRLVGDLVVIQSAKHFKPSGMLLENKDATAPLGNQQSAEHHVPEVDCDEPSPAAVTECGTTSCSSQPASPAPSDVTAPLKLASRLSDAWDDLLRAARATDPRVDDPLHRGMHVLWVPPQKTQRSAFSPVALIAVVGDDGTLTQVDFPLKIGDCTFLVPKEENGSSSDTASSVSDSNIVTNAGNSGTPTSDGDSKKDRLISAASDVTEGLYLECPDFEDYAQAMLDAEVTIVRNVLAAHPPEGERERALLERLERLCERRWSEEPARAIIDKFGCDLVGNRGLVEFLVCHMRLVLQTQPEFAKLQHTLINTLETQLLRIQTDFVDARIAARTRELQQPLQSEAVAAISDISSDSADSRDINPSPFGPFGTPPKPERWDW